MDLNNNDDFNSTTNWKLAGGTLTNSISFESSLTANHESESSVISTAVDHPTKSPLLLLPPIPNGEPCEITVTFAQEHELRQVYIRSSARVYEVYYTKKRGNDKEYLCTVRCGVAIREEEVFQVPLIESDASKRVKDLIEKRVKDNGNERTNEDDWVEVNNEKDLLPMLQLGKQDFYEATAEINDVEPCISITLRLLSLHDKRCALVDEVYVFADPVDPSETEQEEEASGIGNSSSSSLMAMFMPALLQLSRGKDVRKEQDREISEKSNSMNPGDTIVNETNFSKADHIGVNAPVLVDTIAKRVDAETGVSGAEIKPSTVSCNNVETILDQLVKKVSRIETILTRFEDQMLKPISSIDARLQLVEKKLEQLEKKSFQSELVLETKVLNPDSLGSDETPDIDEMDGLTKYTDNPRLTSCSKIVVPDSSSINGEDCAIVVPKFVELESENIYISGNEKISAESEISNEEVGDSLGRGSFEEKPKRSVSINDALASALAGLLSSHSITDGKYSQALVVKAPEFSDEDDMEIEEKPQTGAKDELENIDFVSESSTSLEKELGVSPCIEDNSHEMINGVYEKLDDSFGGYEEAETVFSFRNNDLCEETVTSSTKADCYIEKELQPINPDSGHELKNPNVTTEMDDVLKSVLGFQPTTSSVDFLTPVLDVEFKSDYKESDINCFYEAFFTGESKTHVDYNNEAFDDNLVSVEDEELKGPPTDTLSSLEMDHYEINEMHLHLNAEILEASLI
ncbi:hypothetical protein V5N11_013535 [Cardamine amara subsp. amara]|uniref:Uncharacterized protein n=1 Tax=Cardamine amara subsp. amara TaxID=228776 RepID=A0ABD1BEC6_CARAN